MAHSKDSGFDSHKRWGNSATKGVGVNSPAMMEARAKFAKSSALKKRASSAHRTYPLKGEVSELRKHRGNDEAEKELHSYRKMKAFSKASGTWGKKNSK